MESRIVTRVLTVGENCDSCAHGGRELCPRWENYSGKVWIWNWIGAERLKWSKGKNLSRAHGGRIIKARCVRWWWNCRGLFRSLLCQYALACYYYDITVLCHLWHLWHLSCHMCAHVTWVTQHVTILNCDILEGLLWILQLQIINQWSIHIKIGTLNRKNTHPFGLHSFSTHIPLERNIHTKCTLCCAIAHTKKYCIIMYHTDQ